MKKPAPPRRGIIWPALKAAFPYTIPIMAGFCLLGLAYGIYMHSLGFSWLYPAAMALLIFGGSLEFVAGTLLLSPFAPLQCLLLALVIQARHLFYGLSCLEKYRGLGWKKHYLVFGLCDETFAINCSARIPPEIDRGWFYFFVTLLNQLYWVVSASLGGLLGEWIAPELEGMGFVMTAMFVVIYLEQFLHERTHLPGLIGFLSALAALLACGPDSFLIPAMLLILLLLLLGRRPLEERLGGGKA